jgi:hypothetical protein
VEIGNVVEELNFVLVQEETSADGVNRCVSPSFVEEATVPV